MKFVLTFISVLFFYITNLFAQNSICGNEIIRSKYFENDSVYHLKRTAINNFTSQWIAENSKKNDLGTKTITTVVHVLYRNSNDSISGEQILSGLEVLNEDFRMLNDDFSNTPIEFQSIAADCEIEFCLAPVDEFGTPSFGITRTQIPDSFDVFNSYFNVNLGGKNPWDNLRFLNVWIVDLSSLGAGIAGFGQPPSAVGEQFDGVVVDYRYWGRIEQANNPPFHLGRTATHEVGHYLNLDHPWGLEYGCQEDDFVDDTPPQYEPIFGCPNVPVYDSCTSMGDGLAFPNYMDYTYEECTTMFTQGQKERMLATLEGPRSMLIEGGICEQTTSLIEKEIESEITVFPNPATDYLQIQLLDEANTISRIKMIDIMGRTVIERKFDGSNKIQLPLPDWIKGVYLVCVFDNQRGSLYMKKVMVN